MKYALRVKYSSECEMPTVWADLFHFTFCVSRKFHNTLCSISPFAQQTISRSSWCVETKFQPCRASFWLRQCRSLGYVYNQCGWKHKFKFQKSYQKGYFSKWNALLKLLYLRTTELYKKWNGSKVQNWAMVRNQLAANEKISARIKKHEHMI